MQELWMEQVLIEYDKLNDNDDIFLKDSVNIVSDSIDFIVRHSTDARWDVVAKAMQILTIGFIRKQLSSDGFRV